MSHSFFANKCSGYNMGHYKQNFKKYYFIICTLLIALITLTGCWKSSDSGRGVTNNYPIDTSSVPAYSGEPYVVINGNEPYFTESDRKSTKAFETYSSLDALGRCGVAYANVCKEIMPTEPREDIGQIKPSGWHNVNYHDLIEDNYLYNRCHLIAHQLAGENANEKNLITGTKYLNTMGMLPFEIKVGDYVRATGSHVLYRVTPIFEGSNLVASGVLMEAYSVEDQGQGIKYCVYCYNVQPGIDIDYSTGESKVSQNAVVTQSKDNSNTGSSYDYVLNRNSKKFHRPDCDSVNDIKDKNKGYYSGSREELIEQGYTPCCGCKP